MEPRRQAGPFVLITDWQAMHLALLRSGDSAPHGIEKDAATVAAESEARYPPCKEARTGPRNLKQHLLLIKDRPKGTVARRPEIRG
jgi:hypothetical protein